MASRLVRRSFDRAAETYDTAATLQRQVCRLLFAAIADAAPRRILDAGCGTGHALGLLTERWPEAEIVPADFAPAMLEAAGGAGVCADIEALPFAPGGRFAVSSLAPGTLAELEAAFAGIDLHRHVLEFAPAEALADACAAAGLTAIRLEQRPLRLHYPDLPALLRALKALGANQVGHGGRRPGLMGKRAWAEVVARYEARRGPAGLPATYEVILCTASRETRRAAPSVSLPPGGRMP